MRCEQDRCWYWEAEVGSGEEGGGGERRQGEVRELVV